MTPLDLTSDMIVAWGGAEVFNQALRLAQRDAVTKVAWDPTTHLVSGRIDMGTGWEMPLSFELKENGSIHSNCPCRLNKELGQVCPHVAALGLAIMITFSPDDEAAAPAANQSAGAKSAQAATQNPRNVAAGKDDALCTTGAMDIVCEVPDLPIIRLEVSGSRAALGAQVYARYGTRDVVCTAFEDPALFRRRDPDDPYVMRVRNMKAEQSARDMLAQYGFQDLSAQITRPQNGEPGRLSIADQHDVLNFLGSGIPYLRRRGWKVILSKRLEETMDAMPMVVPVVHVSDGPNGTFDVGYSYDTAGANVPTQAILTSVRRGQGYLMTNGETYLIDADAVHAMMGVFSDCAKSQNGAPPGKFRVEGIYAPYVRAALEALDAVDLEDDCAPAWRAVSAARNRDTSAKFEAVDLGRLESILRPYQKQGVYWMRFLEKGGYCGLLADEMGLGKTLQTLTWLSLKRIDSAALGKPALVICPTSLVRNWEAEAEKFTPWLRRLVISGPDRARLFAQIPSVDLVITSYALVQRDLEAAYIPNAFSVIVLDEAQRIKNRTTRNAQAVKEIDSVARLVLTGTPVENSVSDVWSIFDFLTPGYLGDYDSFKLSTEQPIAEGGRAGAAAQEKLRHLLHPFILRRLKTDVAKDLPDKIVKVQFCPTTPDQQRAELEIRAAARGVKTKFEMLSVLMRLRQAANHLGLLKNPTVPSAEPSGKIEAFLDLLEEAMEGGHRILVFSQFVSMLDILRKKLVELHIPYCYLDGSTSDRLGECRKFNANPAIPVFLISLMAGGTGLNLTGADMVVHFDPWWNPAVEDQATDRAHRIGQKKKVVVVKLISEHTVEERVLALQKKKQLVIEATVNATDSTILSKLTFDDVKALAGI